MDRDGAARPTPDRARADRRAWICLAVIALPCLLYSMDLTVQHLAAQTLPAPLAGALLAAARDAFVQALQATSLIGAIGLAAMAAVAAFLLRDVEIAPHTARMRPQ